MFLGSKSDERDPICPTLTLINICARGWRLLMILEYFLTLVIILWKWFDFSDEYYWGPWWGIWDMGDIGQKSGRFGRFQNTFWVIFCPNWILFAHSDHKNHLTNTSYGWKGLIDEIKQFVCIHCFISDQNYSLVRFF